MTEAGKPAPSANALAAQQSCKLALSVALLYWLALWMNWDMPKYGALAIVLISLDTKGASLRKGMLRIVGTTFGLGVGLVGLAWFAQDRWLMLLFQASYLAVIGYFMKASRYGYAWFVAGFLPSLVWATTYGKVDNAIHYATFRYLETVAGIAIYAIVSTLLWPRRAGDHLDRETADVCHGLRQLFGQYRQQLSGNASESEGDKLKAQLAASTAKLQQTLLAAYVDTPRVAASKRAWELFQQRAGRIEKSLTLWSQSIDDCRCLEMRRHLPRLDFHLDQLERRLAQLDDLAEMLATTGRSANSQDGESALPSPTLPSPTLPDVAVEDYAELSDVDRAALSGFARELNELDCVTGEMLCCLEVLAGVAQESALPTREVSQEPNRATGWNPTRLIDAMTPAASFTLAYFLWIALDPPTGPSVPNMAATFALVFLLSPVKAVSMLPVLLAAMWGCVAPVYFLVMPRLSTGLELLVLIFSFTFVLGLLSGRLSGLRTLSLILFVMMTGISNQQSYSFQALLNPALMMLLALGSVAVVQILLSPRHPEQAT